MEEKTNWIEKFKRISWEPEILISGGILFTLFQAKSVLLIVHNQFYPLALTGFKTSLIFLTLSISALTVGFTLHLITKSFWIALLALKSVFPKGIDAKKIKYSEHFWQKTSIDLTLNKKIAAVGNASSLIFTISFLALFIILGVFNYLILVLIIGNFIDNNLNWSFSIVYLILAPLVISLIDFVTLGGLKKSRIISRIYYPIYTLISWITFSFLYREVLYTIISNLSKKRIALFSILFISLSSLLTYWNSADFMIRKTTFNNWEFYNPTFSTAINERFYENLRQSSVQVPFATIQSDVIKDNHIKLYLRYVTPMDWWLDSLAESHPTYTSNQVLNKFFFLELDNKRIDSASWFFTTKQDINQPGLIGYIPIYNLRKGAHQLNIKSTANKRTYTIPFWKE